MRIAHAAAHWLPLREVEARQLAMGMLLRCYLPRTFNPQQMHVTTKKRHNLRQVDAMSGGLPVSPRRLPLLQLAQALGPARAVAHAVLKSNKLTADCCMPYRRWGCLCVSRPRLLGAPHCRALAALA